jgi:DNA-binding PucR family transcriptional regulator
MPDTPEELARIARDVQLRLSLVEQKLSSSYADRDWVRDFIEPTRTAVVKIETSVNTLTGEMRQLSDKVSAVFAAHDQFLEEKRQNELQSVKDATPLGLVKKYTPVASLFVLIVAIFRVMGSLAEYWLSQMQGK